MAPGFGRYICDITAASAFCSHHMGQTYRMWVDDMLMWRDHPTFLSTGARSPKENVSFHVHLCADMYVLKRSGSLNYTLQCTKNDVRCQLVEIMTYSRVNDKFPHKQTLTECIFEPYMSRLRQPWYHQIPYWALMSCNHLWSITHQKWLHQSLSSSWVYFWRLWVGRQQSQYW